MFRRLAHAIREWWHRRDAEAARAIDIARRLSGSEIDDADIAARRELRELSPMQTRRLRLAIKAGEPVEAIAHRFGLTAAAVELYAEHMRRLTHAHLAALARVPSRKARAVADNEGAGS